MGLRIGLLLAACMVIAVLGLFGLETLGAIGRPPQPLNFGTVQWNYETGFTVDGVRRVSEIRLGSKLYKTQGEFYLVNVRVVCPFGERYHWDDNDAIVLSYAGSGSRNWDDPSTTRGGGEGKFHIDEPVQQALDRMTKRPGARHEILGASQRELIVFDLPRDTEQPGITFTDANDYSNLLNLIVGDWWQPHRFNLRYD